MKLKLLALFPLLLFYSLAFSLKKEFDFMGLKIGMTQDEVTNILAISTNLKIDESRFFGKINDAVPYIIKANFFPFINNLYIQFNDNRSYGITIEFNPNYFDFSSLSETLENKYGPPTKKTSRIVLWDSQLTNSEPGSDIKLRLEYPSTVKVLDAAAMKAVNSELSQNIVRITNESIIESNRRALMDEL